MKYRLPAEWEPQSAVQLSFPHPDTDWANVLEEVMPCFVAIAESVARFEKVLIVSSQPNETARLLSHIPANRLQIVECPSNDTWARDHGGITVQKTDGSGQFEIINFVFNGWGLKFPADKDNQITETLHRKGVFRAPIRHGGLVLEGGGIESNGEGVLLTTAECMLSPNRNPHLTESEIVYHLQQSFGVKNVILLRNGYLEGDDTDSHIDTLARFCTPDTIAYVQCNQPNDPHFEALQKMEAELLALKGFRCVPLPWPDACYDDSGQRLPATYANFLIINGAVLVPTYEVPQDEAALQVFKNLFPDREIIGIPCRPLILQHGSLHCVTMQYPEGVVA